MAMTASRVLASISGGLRLGQRLRAAASTPTPYSHGDGDGYSSAAFTRTG